MHLYVVSQYTILLARYGRNNLTWRCLIRSFFAGPEGRLSVSSVHTLMAEMVAKFDANISCPPAAGNCEI
jgi:hypothetical protein